MAIKLLFISQLEKSEVRTTEIEQSLDQHRVPTSTEEYEVKLMKVTESSKSTAESVSINNFYVPLTSPLYFIL